MEAKQLYELIKERSSDEAKLKELVILWQSASTIIQRYFIEKEFIALYEKINK